MKCPRCDGELKEQRYDTILVDSCEKCKGIWLDENELDQLEDTVWSDDELKGTLETHEVQGNLICPKCDKTMVRFNYRFYDLELDTCPDMHGFWLDNGEDKRIKELMTKEKADFKRKLSAEEDWAISLGRIKSKTFMGKVKSFFYK